MVKRIISLLIVSALLNGCADVNVTNQLIADANKHKLESYSAGMAACGDNAACQVGLSAAYFSNAGQQQFYKPDTAVDYLRAGLPYADLAFRIADTWWTRDSSGDSAGVIVAGDDNILIGIGNKTSSDNGSTSSTSFEVSNYVEQLQQIQSGGDGGVSLDKSAADPIEESEEEAPVEEEPTL